MMETERKKAAKEIVVAIDHGLSFPETVGLERPIDLLRELVSLPEVDGLIATAGMYRQAERNGIDLERLNRLITVDCVLADDHGGLAQRQTVISPEDAAVFRPDGYKMFLNVYEDHQELMANIQDLSRFITAGRKLGVATLAEIMFFGNERFKDPATQAKELYRGCRIAMELVADILKVPLIADLDALGEIIEKVKLPTYIMGGSASPVPEELVRAVAPLKNLPIRGLMFGRNLWQYSDMAQRVHLLAQCLND